MLRKISWTIAYTILVFVVAGFFLPTQRHVERSIVVERPASVVFSLLDGYGHFNQWSPWAARDPRAQYRHSGPAYGEGARLDWSGDPRVVGTGWQRITESIPYERISMHLDFGEQGTASSRFLIRPAAQGVELTWSFDTDVTQGKSVLGSLLGRYFGLFLEKWVGADYEQGLNSFKAYAETFPGVDFAGAQIGFVEAEPQRILFVNGASNADPEAVAQALAEAYSRIIAFMAEHDVELAGQPMAITRDWRSEQYRFEAALPVDRVPDELDGLVQAGYSPSGQAVRLIHVGPYDVMQSSYEQLESFLAAHRIPTDSVSWEHYVSDPGNTPPEALVTHIYHLVPGAPEASQPR